MNLFKEYLETNFGKFHMRLLIMDLLTEDPECMNALLSAPPEARLKVPGGLAQTLSLFSNDPGQHQLMAGHIDYNTLNQGYSQNDNNDMERV